MSGTTVQGLLRLGTRGSRLALRQADGVAERLRDAGHGPVALVPVSTVGDRDRRAPFAELGGRGIFSSELEQALLDGRIDLAVHSAKDLTTDETDGLTVAAVLERGDPRDAWCGPHASLAEVPEGARVGTASARRTAQLRCLRPDLRVEPLRGNVDTRLRKRVERGLDGVLLAACGLDRLDLGHEIGFRADPAVILPEAGQGFLALQCRREDETRFAPLGDPGGLRELRAERAAVRALGGGCALPVAAFAERRGDVLHLRAWMADPDGARAASAEGTGGDPEVLGRAVADRVLEARR